MIHYSRGVGAYHLGSGFVIVEHNLAVGSLYSVIGRRLVIYSLVSENRISRRRLGSRNTVAAAAQRQRGKVFVGFHQMLEIKLIYKEIIRSVDSNLLQKPDRNRIHRLSYRIVKPYGSLIVAKPFFRTAFAVRVIVFYGAVGYVGGIIDNIVFNRERVNSERLHSRSRLSRRGDCAVKSPVCCFFTGAAHNSDDMPAVIHYRHCRLHMLLLAV